MTRRLPPEEFYRSAADAERKVQALLKAYKDAIAERNALVDEAYERPDVIVTRVADEMSLDRRRLKQIRDRDNLNGYQRRRLREQASA